MIKIGKRSLETRKPADLEASQVNGLSSAETVAVLGGSPLASTVAAGLVPFLKEPVSLPELAGWIAEAGIDEVRAAVVELYTKATDGKEA